MKLNLDQLKARVERRKRPAPPEEEMAKATRWGGDLLERNGYPNCPASAAIARHAGHVEWTRKPDEPTPGFRSDWGQPPQGLILMGSVGTGKTTALRILAAAFDWHITSWGEIARRFGAGGIQWLDQWLDTWDQQHVVLDDLGSEGATSHYGSPVPVSEIIDHRYNRWDLFGWRTYFSTNLVRDELLARYGERTVDRIAQMCQTVTCCWQSFRRAGQ